MGGEWPLVGRAGELRKFCSVLSAAEAQGVVLAGPAGVGKTRLASECLDLAQQSGVATARVTASRAAMNLPFGALAPLLPAVDHGQAGSVDDRADLLRRSAAALTEGAEGRPLLLMVDDAHLLDDASATLVYQLAAGGAAFVLATVRSSEPAPDPVVALWKDGLAERVELGGLRAETIQELVASVLGGRLDPAAATRFVIRCQGNVLFLRELVVGCLEDGTLRDDGGIWRLVGPLSPSDRLVELVEARLGDLTPADRDVLEVVSFGEPLGLADLSSLADRSLAVDLERKGLLLGRADGRRLEIRLGHPLYGEVLRARIPAIRARTVAQFLAEAVERTGARRREDTLRIATWRLDGGGGRPDIMLAAAITARWRYDFPLAERLARAAMAGGGNFEAALLAAQLASLQGRGPEAEAELAQLADRAEDDRQRGLVAITRLDNVAMYMGRLDEGFRIAAEAEASIADPTVRDEIAARRLALVLGTQGPRAAAEAAAPLLDRAEGRTLVWASQVACHSLGRLGRLEAALDVASRGYATHLELTQPLEWYPWVHIFFRCEALADAGRLAEAEALATAQYQQALTDRSSEAQAWFAWSLVKMVGNRGHIGPAVNQGREAVALFRQLGRPQFMQFSLIYLALALALGGRAEDAAQALADFDELGLPPTIYLAVDLLQARAWTAVAGGDLPLGRKLLEEAADVGRRIGDRVGEAVALHGVARLGHPKDARGRLEALAAEMESDLSDLRAGHASALEGNDASRLEEVSIAFEATGADLLAAEAAADAAVAWRRRGDVRAATATELRVSLLLDRCDGANTPALQTTGSRVRLTRAEREAALLAAAGRSNKDIAEELFLSVRTVEGRLQRVYEKLGVSGRSELAAALEAAGTA